MEYKWKGSILGWLVGLVVSVQIFLSCLSALAALVSPVQILLTANFFYCICTHRAATWAASRAGSLVSWYVSLVCTEKNWEEYPRLSCHTPYFTPNRFLDDFGACYCTFVKPLAHTWGTGEIFYYSVTICSPYTNMRTIFFFTVHCPLYINRQLCNLIQKVNKYFD